MPNLVFKKLNFTATVPQRQTKSNDRGQPNRLSDPKRGRRSNHGANWHLSCHAHVGQRENAILRRVYLNDERVREYVIIVPLNDDWYCFFRLFSSSFLKEKWE